MTEDGLPGRRTTNRAGGTPLPRPPVRWLPVRLSRGDVLTVLLAVLAVLAAFSVLLALQTA